MQLYSIPAFREHFSLGGYLRQIRNLLCAILVFGLSSCDSGVETSARTTTPELPNHAFDNLVRVKLATLGPNGPIEFSSGEELKGILARQDSEKVLAQETDFDNEQIGQQINPDSSSPFIVRTDGKQPNDFHVVYNNLSPNMGGMFYSNNADFVNHEINEGQAIWSYGQIDEDSTSDGKIGVVIGGFGADSNTRVISNGTGIVQVVVDFRVVTNAQANERTYDITASIEGTEVFSVTGLKRPIYVSGGSGNTDLPIIPIFESSASGTYAIEVDDEGDSGENFGTTYFVQRGLEFVTPLQDFTLAPGAIANISNSFQWDFGDSPTSLLDASWDIEITDPEGQAVTTLSGTGRTISANWDTSALENTGPLRLLPLGQVAPDGGTPTYNYKITIRALAYADSASDLSAVDNDGMIMTLEDVFYEISSSEDPAEVKIVNAELTPNPPFQNLGDTVDFRADIITIGLDDVTEEDVDWWVDLLDENEQQVGAPLATGKGFEVTATWDGTVGGVPVEDPSSYHLKVRASVCGENVNLQQAEIRAQAPGCHVAQIVLAVGGTMKFFDLAGEARTTMKPSYLFEVKQITDVIDRNGQDPGIQQSEVLDKGKPSLIKVQVNLALPRTSAGILKLRVRPLQKLLPTEDPAGHSHSDPAPSGLLFEQKPAADLTLSTNQKSWIGDVSKEGGNPISDVREIDIPIAAGVTEVSAYYLAPVTSGRRLIQLLDGEAVLASKVIKINVDVDGQKPLQPLFPQLLTLSPGIYVVEDVGAPAPVPEQRDKGVMVTGKTSKHTRNVYGDAAFNTKIVELAKIWGKKGSGMLWINDMSLPQGGKFDINGDYSQRSQHFEHRLGRALDISTEKIRDGVRDPDFERLCKKAKLAVYMELADKHYHLRPLSSPGGQ